MTALTDVLTLPGGLIFDMFFYSGLPEDGDVQARVDMAPMLGVVFWMGVLLLVGLTVVGLRARRQPPGLGLSQSLDRASARAERIAAPLWRVTSRQRQRVEALTVWAAVWRAQGVHVLLYAGIPLAWELARGGLLIVTAPLWIIGPGSGPGATDGTLAHLRSPYCWTFVTACAGPRSTFLHDKVIDASTCRGAGNCGPGRSKLPDTGGWLWKGVWLLMTLAWLTRARPASSKPRKTLPKAGPP